MAYATIEKAGRNEDGNSHVRLQNGFNGHSDLGGIAGGAVFKGRISEIARTARDVSNEYDLRISSYEISQGMYNARNSYR